MLFNFILQVANENPYGFTLQLETLEQIAAGVVVAYAETQNQFGVDGLQFCIQHAVLNDGYVGGWRNTEGLYQFDSVRIFTDLRAAVKWGREQKQVAIFDLDNKWEIIL